jgi:hypothetical protein
VPEGELGIVYSTVLHGEPLATGWLDRRDTTGSTTGDPTSIRGAAETWNRPEVEPCGVQFAISLCLNRHLLDGQVTQDVPNRRRFPVGGFQPGDDAVRSLTCARRPDRQTGFLNLNTRASTRPSPIPIKISSRNQDVGIVLRHLQLVERVRRLPLVRPDHDHPLGLLGPDDGDRPGGFVISPLVAVN